jgi:hypothetical protein
MIEDFIKYVSRYDPQFPARIRGSSPKEIGTLQQLSGRLLPAKYSDFLARMGQDAGGLKLTDEPRTEIAEVLEYYREFIVPGDVLLPAGHIVIAAGGLQVFELSVECDAEERLPVFILERGKVRERHADAFDKLLYRSAFGIFRAKLLPYSAIYTSTPAGKSLAAAVKVAKSLGFAPLWFSDSVRFCSERDDGVVLIISRGYWIRVAARSKLEAEKVGDVFVQQYGIKFDQWWPK